MTRLDAKWGRVRAEGGWREMGEQHLRKGTMLGREARFKVLKSILRDHQDNPKDDREVMVGKQDTRWISPTEKCCRLQ